MVRSVLDKEEAEKVAINFTPRKFPLTIAPTAREFVALQSGKENPNFHIDRIVAQQTGVAELERISLEEKVEREALAKLKEIEENAYQAAYQLGLDEGKEKAFQENSAHMTEKLAHFEELITSISNLKSELVSFNETHLIKLIYYIASKIALKEIAENPELVMPLIRQSIESAQSEEKVTVRLSPSDYVFVEENRERVGREMEILKKVKLDQGENVRSGGCVVETNYGVVDATIEQRLNRMWEALVEKAPRSKDVAEG